MTVEDLGKKLMGEIEEVGLDEVCNKSWSWYDGEMVYADYYDGRF